MSDIALAKSPGRRRANPNYLNAILMITLVLVLLGLVGLLVLNAQMFSQTLKESIRVSVYLRDDLNEVEQLQLRKKVESEPFVRETAFISKEEARGVYARRFGEDASEILGEYNPFPASYEIGLKSGWVNADSMAAVAERLETYREVRNVKAHNDVVTRLNESLNTVGLVLGAISLLILLIAITLIDKTIRLAMFANRFIIRSMQLVGATRWFIIAPYIKRGLLNGLIASLLAIAILIGLLVAAQRTLQAVPIQEEYLKFAGLFAGILILGLLISSWSTHRSVGKYLGMKLDELY